MLRTVAVTLLVTFTTVGCYNTYYLKQDTFAGLQKAETRSMSVTDSAGEAVQVSDDTKLFARSTGGRRYQITPFNFKMTKSQLVASDRDYILMLDEVDSYEVDKLSTWKTVGLISLGVAAVGGLITAMAIMYGSKQIGEN